MKPWIVALALTLAVPVASHAAERDPARGFKTLDTDGDGRISKAEAQANAPRLYAHFDQIDTNGDGYITPEELAAARQNHHRGGQQPQQQ